MPDLRLPGCTTRPLIGYLKALGVLRIVARQADATARARWSGTSFELRTTLSEEALLEFLMAHYEPSPVLSPWNAGSGFYPHANTTAVNALAAIERAEDERFERYRSLIVLTRDILARLEISEKFAEDKKQPLVRELRARWPDEAIGWLDAAIVIAGGTPAYPPLLGSGGNEGRYDFSSNYMQALVTALSSADLLDAALLGSSATLRRISLAHFRGDASPTSSPTGASTSLGNPWDLVLALEGCLLLVGGAARRHADDVRGLMTAPFTVRSTAAGYGGAVAGEKGRAELWLPLWSGWATQPELANLIRESRAQVRSGGALRSARSGLDFARAAGELGIARGIDAFERYTILERSGQANLAVPAGRVEVAERPAAAGLASIDYWLGRLLRFAGADNCPTGIAREIRRLERACFALASRGRPVDAVDVIERMGAVEGVVARSGSAIGSGLRPLRGAPAAAWLREADDGSAEFAVAVSIGSLRTDDPGVPALRDYLHGTVNRGREFDRERRHRLTARSPGGLLAAIHARSHLESARSASGKHSRLGFERGTWCNVRLTRLLAAGRLDVRRILRLIRGIALLDHHGRTGGLPPRADQPPVAAPAYDMLALAWWGTSLHADVPLGPRPGWAARLTAGAVGHVLRDAALRLRMAGMVPLATPQDLIAGAPDGELLAGALLVGLSTGDRKQLTQHAITNEEKR